MTIPFLDLKTPHAALADELRAAFDRVLASGWFILGDETAQFEAEFAAYCGARHCIGVGNGLEALVLLLQAHDIGPGDEVIVPSNTFVATWLAVSRCGAVPVPVEPDPRTYNLDPDRVAAAIGPRTRAILPVHLYGQPADMAPIMALARERGVLVFEDAAQAQGARYHGRRTGALADGAATSFYPGKNLGALGDGGAVLTDDDAVAARVRRLRNYGSDIKYQHDELGMNSRLDEMQSALLRIKLRHLDAANARRRALAARYLDGLAGTDLVLPVVPAWAEPAWHLFVVRSRVRDQLQRQLGERGIGTMVHYPIPPHRQRCYAAMAATDLPIAAAQAGELLSLPMYPTLTDAQASEVIDAIRTLCVPSST